MSTDKYEFGNVSIGTTGWNAIVDANVTKTEAHLHSRLLLTADESIDAWSPVCIGPNGNMINAQAGSTSSRKPAIGLAIEACLQDSQARVQRVGEVEYESWTWNVGKKVYLSTTEGELTQTKPGSDEQLIGIATSATKILLLGNVTIIGEITPSTTTTTTSTTTTFTSTTTTTV